MNDLVYVAPSGSGRAVFAARPIRRGEEILRFTGPVVSGADLRAATGGEGKLLQVAPDAYIDREGPGAFVAHCCAPNAGVVGGTALVALRDIRQGEAVAFDYSTTIGPGAARAVRCRCGSSACRGTVGPFGTLPAELQLWYAALGVVQRYLLAGEPRPEADPPGVPCRVRVGGCRLGKGVFASEHVRAGEALFRFSGPVITKAEVLAKGGRMGDPLQVGIDAYLDVGEPGLSINHSCDPNAGVRAGTTLVAIRDIAEGGEVCMDYSTTISSDDGWVMECRCDAPSCRRLVGAFANLPASLQRRYAGLGVVPAFILQDAGLP